PCEDDDDTVKGVCAPMGNSVLNNEAGYVSDESSSSAQGGAEEKSDPPESKTGENIYVLDASTEGNVGRFLNHSCSPNLFVQHVFVETHSKNFPWVAFFTKSTWTRNMRCSSFKLPAAFLVIKSSLQAWKQNAGPASFLFIKAGTELTWEYNYDIGNVPETEISCVCGHKKCKNKII
ncbi:unnamed protein product, partial [Ranitomeya imitator]